MRTSASWSLKGLAEVAGLIALVLFASALFASSASASVEEPVSLCEESNELCETRYPAGTAIEGVSNRLNFHFSSTFDFNCYQASLGLKNSEQVGDGSVPVELTSFNPSECYWGEKNGYPCEATASILDPTATLEGQWSEIAWLKGFAVKWHLHCHLYSNVYYDAYIEYGSSLTVVVKEGKPATIEFTGTGGITCAGMCEGYKGEIRKGEFEIKSPEALYVRESYAVSGTSLCKSESVNGPGFCGTANRYPSETQLSAGLKGSTMLSITTKETSVPSFTCTESTFTPTTAASIGKPLALTLGAWTFGDCVRNRNGGTPQPCEMSLTKAGALGISASGGIDGALSFGETVLRYRCENLPIIGTVECVLVPEGTASVQGGAPAHIAMSSLKLNKIEGSTSNCPKQNTLTASYELTSPKPVYVAGESDEY